MSDTASGPKHPTLYQDHHIPTAEEARAAGDAFAREMDKERHSMLALSDTAADRIAKAPRAWGLYEQPGDTLSAHSLYNSEAEARQDAQCYENSRVVPIAIVELEEGE